MAEYLPSPREWVRDQVETYERSVAPKALRSVTPGCRSYRNPCWQQDRRHPQDPR